MRILVGVAGRSLPMMAGMTIGAMDALMLRRELNTPASSPALTPVVVGVSGGAIAAAALVLGMPREKVRQIAIDYPEARILGTKTLRTMVTRRTLYAGAQVRELAHAVVGDRTFADFTLDPQPGRQPHQTPSSLLIPVFSARHGTLLLPRDLPKLGLSDLLVADALVAATRIPGALPAADGLDDVFDGGCQYRVPYDIFTPNRSLILDLYGPEPHDSRGGLLFPLLHPSLPPIGHRPRPYRDASLLASTIFAHQPYGAALEAPTRSPEDLFDTGYTIAAGWVHSRSNRQLTNVVDPHILGLPDYSGILTPIP